MTINEDDKARLSRRIREKLCALLPEGLRAGEHLVWVPTIGLTPRSPETTSLQQAIDYTPTAEGYYDLVAETGNRQLVLVTIQVVKVD